jgi:protein-S-isoprenylcysteine O-methyltransferase Ste14
MTPSDRRGLELRVPPPVLLVLVAAAMWVVASATAPVPLSLSARVALTTMLALLGLAVSGSGVVAIRGARTTRSPLHPETATALVSTGAYAVTRNPMYLGMLLLLLAWAAALASAVALVGPLAFAAFIARYQIEPEERVLASLFGADYLAYKKRVRRWL